MLDFESQKNIKEDIIQAISQDKNLLNTLRKDLSILKNNVHKIHSRTTTAVAMVGTDGGNNKFQFDPFLVQVLRVVDSSNNQLFLKVVTTETNIHELSKIHFNNDGSPADAVGNLMIELGVTSLSELSHMLKSDANGKAQNSGWLSDYREIIEWASLYELLTNRVYGTDTIIIFDGLFRTKVFWPKQFDILRSKIKEAIEKHKQNKRNIYVVGIAKHTQILIRYRLAMMLENILDTKYPSFVEVPTELERKVYIHDEWTSHDEEQLKNNQFNHFSAGHMYFVKFGPRPMDPIWAVDVFMYQKSEASKIIGYLLADANNGFPVPYYPMSLQTAHNYAALVDFDYDILQGSIYTGIRNLLEEKADVLDRFQLMDSDPASKRY